MIDYHHMILLAIEARDADRAERAIVDDIRGASSAIIEQLAALKPTGSAG